MRIEEVKTVLAALEDAGVETWLEGGWGIDALVGHQTRDHRDVDVDIDATQEATAVAVLEGLGYAVQTDWRPTRVELVAIGRGWVDLHPLQFGLDGDARQAAPDGTFWHFPKRYFARGRLAGRDVGCFSIEAQRSFHTGYELRAKDRLDLATLDRLEADPQQGVAAAAPALPSVLADDDAELLAGGNASGPVLRIGATVRKPWTAATGGVVAFMQAVRAAGVDVPDSLGRDGAGRHVLEFVPGRLAMDGPLLDLAELARVGGIVRAVHDASDGFRPPGDVRWETAIPSPGDELICHNDLAPWNPVIGERWVFIDWDAAGPSTRLWDLAYAAQAFTLQDPDEPLEHAAARLRAFVDGYGADEQLRDRLPQTMVERATAMHDLLRSSHESGREPWASMHVDGHGAHWSSVVGYTDRHRAVWGRALSTGG